ncbi:hypothetical protein, partial [Pseudodesulfovibrio sp. JC047]|uniref:hypothetical protein n=1 Tax=Pseudodesulfovibrio sp. JC047 TaxID=2683199 RepID=UPI00193F8773
DDILILAMSASFELHFYWYCYQIKPWSADMVFLWGIAWMASGCLLGERCIKKRRRCIAGLCANKNNVWKMSLISERCSILQYFCVKKIEKTG